jgi:hypothetical protein
MPRPAVGVRVARSAENRDGGQTGTLHALYCSSKSVTPFETKPTVLGHGGARLRADRTSHSLTIRQARAIMLAALAADDLGEPFTRMVTVHWQRAGIADHRAASATGKLTKLASDWARRRGARILWAWARENDHGKGSHLHLLLSCPPHLPIGRMWRRWLRAITGQPYRVGTINTRRIGGSLGIAAADPAAYRQNLFNAAAYICKGVRPVSAAALGIQRVEDGGTVIGKRAAVCPRLLAQTRVLTGGRTLSKCVETFVTQPK